MYLDHFGLQQPPFRITPHTEFFFAGARRGATLDALIYAITHDEGIVKVSGEVGSGKTMLCRMLLEKLPESVETIYLANPLLSHAELRFAIAEELRIALPAGHSQSLLRALQERLLETYAAGRQVVALIDEAHAMPATALEEIRLLSNLESSRHKLLQIVLFGQPELDQRLRENSMRQLNERITHRFRLAPLAPREVGVYLMFRLRAAGYRGPDLFSRRAIRLISQASQGLTRRINVLADKALLAAFSEGVHQVGSREVRAAISDAQFRRLPGTVVVNGRSAGAALGIALIASLAYFAGGHNASREIRVPTQSIAPEQPGTPATALAGKLPLARPAQAAATAARTGVGERPFTLDERLAATEDWLKQTPDHHHFIQLLVTDAASHAQVEAFITTHARLLDLRQVRVYRSLAGGRDRLGVIYGNYPSREQANAALTTLGEITPGSRPYVRAVARLRPGRPAEAPLRTSLMY
ncbi:MAG: AAA family ATPase [Candidatus Accumulibacter sp. UW26]|jgi:MSHA biogenesis protein MshM